MSPEDMTAYLQTLNITIKKPFENHFSTEINDCFKNRIVRNQRRNFVKPKLQEVVTWVKNAWNKVTNNCVADGLRAGYMDKKRLFEESPIAQHERLGLMVLEKMKFRKIQTEFLYLELYEYVLEEDDCIALE